MHILIFDVNSQPIALSRVQKHIVNYRLLNRMDVLLNNLVNHHLNATWFLVFGINFI